MIVGIRKPLIKYKFKIVIIKLILFILFFYIAYSNAKNQMAFRDNYYLKLVDGSQCKVYGELYKKEIKKSGYAYYLKDCYISLSNKYMPCNKILVYVDVDDCSIGSTLTIVGQIKKFNKATNEGQFDVENFYLSQKIDFSIYANYLECLEDSKYNLKNFLYQIRGKMCECVLNISDDKHGGIINSMLWGDKSLLDSSTKNLYAQSGISHILAISGLHVSMIGMGLYKFLRKRRMNFWNTGIVVSFVVICYTIMTGMSISTERAAGMLILSIFAMAAGRSYDLLSGLGIMIMFIIGDNVFALRYAGFVFSVGAILGIGITVNAMLGDSLDEENNNIIKEKIVSGIALQMSTIPIISYYYYEVPCYSIFLNIIVLVLVEYLFISGILGSIIALVNIELAKFIIVPAKVILDLYEKLSQLSMKMPKSQIITGKPNFIEIIIYYILLFCFIALIIWGRKKKCRFLILKSICFIGMFYILFIPNNKNELDILDVGQGLAIYGNTKEGLNYFVDGGSTSDGQIGENVILPFLKCRGIGKIDYWFISHSDEDHISGLRYVMEQGYIIENLVVYKNAEDNNLKDLVLKAKQNGANIIYMKYGDCIRTQEINIMCINEENVTYEDKNDMSLCLQINYIKNDYSILACGDISELAEKEMLCENRIRKIDLYIANHHGSKYSSSDVFLREISPKQTIISCAKKNKYGHPSREAVERIEAVNSEIKYTMKEGQIKIIVLDTTKDYN